MAKNEHDDVYKFINILSVRLAELLLECNNVIVNDEYLSNTYVQLKKSFDQLVLNKPELTKDFAVGSLTNNIELMINVIAHSG